VEGITALQELLVGGALDVSRQPAYAGVQGLVALRRLAGGFLVHAFKQALADDLGDFRALDGRAGAGQAVDVFVHALQPVPRVVAELIHLAGCKGYHEHALGHRVHSHRQLAQEGHRLFGQVAFSAFESRCLVHVMQRFVKQDDARADGPEHVRKRLLARRDQPRVVCRDQIVGGLAA
jgi:hypothetical protein